MWRRKKVGHTSEFLLGIYWWTWKTTIYYKNCWSEPIKNVRILIFTTLYFLKKKGKHLVISLFYSYVPKCLWYDLKFLRYKVYQTEIANYGSIFCPLTLPHKNQTNPNFEKLKNTAGDIIVLHVYQKAQFYEVQLLRYGMRLTEFFVILGHFLLFYPPPPLTPWPSKFWKNEKSIWWCITLHVYTLPKITIICMLPEICSAKDNFLSFWPIFRPFTLLLTPKIKIWKKCKKT